MSGTVKREPLRADELMKLSESERVEELVRVLNRLSDDASGALNRRLTIRDNLRTQLVEKVPINIGEAVESAFPFTLDLGPHMPETPALVLVSYVKNNTSATAPWTAGVCPFWEKAGQRQIAIKYISGLSANTQYLVDFLIWS